MFKGSFASCLAFNTAQYTRSYSTSSTWSPLKVLDEGSLEVFRREAFKPSLPAILPRGLFLGLPAVQKWFLESEEKKSLHLSHAYLSKFGDIAVPLEYTVLATPSVSEAVEATFQRSEVPFKLFLDWTRHATTETPNRLYLAQASFNDLPRDLADDLPTPDLVAKAGCGDVYDTNLWIGVPPTYTPLHRDPNPNLFVQLAGQKTVRLLAPEKGQEVFASVQTALGKSTSASFRGEEMMKGKENALLEARIWDDNPADDGINTFGYDASLDRGDGLFIPKGWWHSIKGVGNGITGSVRESPQVSAGILLSTFAGQLVVQVGLLCGLEQCYLLASNYIPNCDESLGVHLLLTYKGCHRGLQNSLFPPDSPLPRT